MKRFNSVFWLMCVYRLKLAYVNMGKEYHSPFQKRELETKRQKQYFRKSDSINKVKKAPKYKACMAGYQNRKTFEEKFISQKYKLKKSVNEQQHEINRRSK